MAGKIKQIHIGEFKNKANKKNKRRVLYFAIITYKSADDCKLILNEPKFLQSKVNKLCKKSAKFSLNPLNDGPDSDNEDFDKKDDHTVKMEEGGFTLVAPTEEGAIKGKGSDGISTVQGIS